MIKKRGLKPSGNGRNSLFGPEHVLVEESGNQRSDERREDEYPDLLESDGGSGDREEYRGSEASRGVDGSSGEVDSYQVDERQASAYCESGLCDGLLLLGNAQNGQGENHRKDDFDDYGSCHRDFIYALSLESVGSQSGYYGSEIVDDDTSGRGCDVVQKSRTDYTTEELEYPVTDHGFRVDSVVDAESKRYRGIDVASRAVSDAVCHRNDRKTESECRGDHVAGVYRNTSSHERQNHGTEKFGNIRFDLCAFHIIPFTVAASSCNICYIMWNNKSFRKLPEKNKLFKQRMNLRIQVRQTGFYFQNI